MFNVLVLSYYFPPMGLSGVQRTLKFTKYMKKYNWNPTVVTTDDLAYYAHDDSLLKEAEREKINIVRTGAKDINSLLGNKKTVKMPREFIRKSLGAISKTVFIPDNKKSWAEKAYSVSEKLLEEGNFDAIYVSVPPFSVFTTAVKLKRKFNLPLIVDYRDLWVGNQFEFLPSPYHKYKHKKLEYDALRNTDKVIVINRKIKERILTNYPFLSFDDVTIIPQGYDPEDMNVTPIPKDNKKIKITYSGIFYEKITPKFFLLAFKKLTEERPDIAANIELHFVGLFRKENQKIVKKLKLEEYIFEHGYLTHKEALKRVLGSDILWVMVGNGPNYETVSTGKLFEYFGTKKPIIACVPDGASKTAAEAYKASYITEPENIEAIKNVFIQVHKDFQQDNLPKPDEFFINEHNREYLTEKLVKEFQFHLKEIE